MHTQISKPHVRQRHNRQQLTAPAPSQHFSPLPATPYWEKMSTYFAKQHQQAARSRPCSNPSGLPHPHLASSPSPPLACCRSCWLSRPLRTKTRCSALTLTFHCPPLPCPLLFVQATAYKEKMQRSFRNATLAGGKVTPEPPRLATRRPPSVHPPGTYRYRVPEPSAGWVVRPHMESHG